MFGLETSEHGILPFAQHPHLISFQGILYQLLYVRVHPLSSLTWAFAVVSPVSHSPNVLPGTPLWCIISFAAGKIFLQGNCPVLWSHSFGIWIHPFWPSVGFLTSMSLHMLFLLCVSSLQPQYLLCNSYTLQLLRKILGIHEFGVHTQEAKRHTCKLSTSLH